ncbi:hypothetical protein ABFT23_04220 [Nocardioides sp. C4-1]|uniref:hypothetical protein n=1 Tax=Nocardioides sp. C4-1 TaxID=3151851 RepID=UPI0032654872
MSPPPYQPYEPGKPGGDLPAEVRVPISTPRFFPVRLVRNVLAFGTGRMSEVTARRFRDDAHPEAPPVTAMTFSPLSVRETGAAYVFDARGLRLEGYRRLRLAVEWTELDRVVLEVQSFAALGLEGLRVAIWPHDPHGFARAHRGVEATWDETAGTWSLVLAKAPVVPPEKVEAAVVGLRHAGHRFTGEVVRSFG